MSNQKPLIKTYAIEAFIVSSIIYSAFVITCIQMISRIGFTPNTSVDSNRYGFAQARMSVLL